MTKILKGNLITAAFYIAGIFYANTVFSAQTFGRFQGVLKHENTNKEQLAKLDFIVARSSSNELDLKAVLTLHFGDFKSGEYVSYHYDKVRFNILTGALVFDNADQALSIYVKNFSGETIVGDVTSVWTGKVGQLILKTEKTVTPTAPLIEPLWGEYSGSCGDVNAKLQLYTMRSTEDLAHLAQPFGTYFIKGSLPIDCQNGSCVNLQITNGSYNYFLKENQLNLMGDRFALRCTVDGDNLKCKDPITPIANHYDMNCTFSRISKETAAPRQFSPVENTGAYSTISSDTPISSSAFSALQGGEYKGYVFHEYLGTYQAASLNLNIFQAGEGADGGTKISAFSRLYFGDFSSPEYIPYRFNEKAYPNPLIGPQNLVLSRIDGNMDAVIQITDYKDGVLRGNWYSIIFGKVGPFELRKDSPPALPTGAKKIESLSGVYRGAKTHITGYPDSQWLIRLQVALGTKPPTSSENPFSPNVLRGTMNLYPVTPNIGIVDGSYDFYTGRLGFLRTDALGQAWIGTQNNSSELELYFAPAVVLGAMPKHKPEKFKREKEFP